VHLVSLLLFAASLFAFAVAEGKLLEAEEEWEADAFPHQHLARRYRHYAVLFIDGNPLHRVQAECGLAYN
jgi:hypothetical protein